MAGYTLTSINKLRLTNEDRESWYADYIRNMNIIDGKLLSANAVTNSMLAADAVEDANVAAAAAIQRSKLASGTADHVVINNASGVMSSEATLAKTRGGTGADNSSVTFPSTGTIVTRTASETLTNKTIDGDDNTLQDVSITSLKTVLADADKVILRDASGVVTSALLANANVSGSAAIAYSKLNLSGSIVNADVNASAAIARSKMASGTASHVIINDGSGVLSSEARLSLDRTADGTNNYVLVAAGVGVNPAYALISNSNIDAAAAIARTKVANGTADHVVINNGSGTLSSEAQLSISRGGTGLSALGTANQVLGVNNAANAAEYKTITSGTSGTDFAVAHSANTITLNLPTASALNRGALSSSDWSTFDAKIGGSGTNGQVALFSGSGTITSNSSIAYATGADTNNISLTSGIKIGTNATAAASAGSGSIRYNSGNLEYSDGAAWLTLGLSGGISSLNSLTAGAQTFANDTNVTITSATATHTIGWSGQLSIARGGTGLGSLGTANQILGVDNGVTAAEYKTLSVGTSGTDFAIAHSAGGIAFNLPDAGASARGVVTTGAQTFAGDKTFSGNTVLNGTVTLGDATSDDVTFNGYVASAILPKTSGSYSLGSATQNWDAIYLDKGATNSGSIYFDAGTTKYIQGDAAGTTLTIGGFTGVSLPAATITNKLQAGSATAITTNTANIIDEASGSTLGLYRFGGSPSLRSYMANGSQASPTKTTSGNNLGSFIGYGLHTDGVGNYGIGGWMRMQATENWSNTAYGTQIEFLTAANGSTSAAVAMTIEQNKNVTIETGNLVIGTSGKGIDFSATSDGTTMTGEILSDYEEGSWTPTDASGASLSFSSVTGSYTKIGRIVRASFRLTYPATASGSQAAISLPFSASSSPNNGGFTSFSTKGTDFPYWYVGISAAITYPYIYGGTFYTNADLSGQTIAATAIYEV